MQDINWQRKREKRLDIKHHVRKFLLYPYFWEDDEKHVTYKIKWKRFKFAKSNISKIPTSNGIYCFIVIPPKPNNFWNTKYLFYIGKAESVSLRQRFKKYIYEKDGQAIGQSKPRIKVQEMLKDFESYLHFYYTELEDKEVIRNIEDKLLNTFMPYVNTAIPEARIKEEYKHIY